MEITSGGFDVAGSEAIGYLGIPEVGEVIEVEGGGEVQKWAAEGYGFEVVEEERREHQDVGGKRFPSEIRE